MLSKAIHIFLILIFTTLIGWLTNYIAIQLLFFPIKEKKFLFFKFQGIIPKKKEKLIKKIAYDVEKNLINHEDVVSLVKTEKNKEVIIDAIRNYIKKIIKDKVPIILQGQVLSLINNYLRKNKDKISEEIIETLSNNLDNISIKERVEEKLKDIDDKELNKIILRIMKEEFKHIEVLGGIIGFVIGIFQIILYLFI